MPITNPTQLVDEFKKSGEFDRLRRELLKQFQRNDGIQSFISRVEDIGRQRLLTDQKLQYFSHDVVYRELMQEVDRYPIVERAVADVRMLSDPSFIQKIRFSAQQILKEDRSKSSADLSSLSSPAGPRVIADGTTIGTGNATSTDTSTTVTDTLASNENTTTDTDRTQRTPLPRGTMAIANADQYPHNQSSPQPETAMTFAHSEDPKDPLRPSTPRSAAPL